MRPIAVFAFMIAAGAAILSARADECDKIKDDKAFNLCLANLSPSAQRPAQTGARETGDDEPAAGTRSRARGASARNGVVVQHVGKGRVRAEFSVGEAPRRGRGR